MIFSIDAEKALDTNQHLLIKTLQKVRVQGIYLSIIKAIHDKPTAKIILNRERVKAIQDQAQDKDVHSCHFYST